MSEPQTNKNEGGRDFLTSALPEKAYKFAEKALTGKIRKSGEPYMEHCVETALTLKRWHLSRSVVIAGLLHSVTGNGVSEEELKREFGAEVASLVKGARSLTEIHYQGLEKHAEDLRRFFIAFAKDLRIIFIAFAHRLHSMQVLKNRSKDDQLNVARETLEIYAPLANRLGMGKVKAQFETLAFPFVYPADYKRTMTLLRRREPIANRNLEKIYRSLRKYFALEKLPILSADYRLKNPFSLWKKLKRYDFDISKISDLMALRLISDTPENCYRVLGLIHAKWKPVPGKVKDYIANPLPNGYQSLHTTIYTGDGSTAEIQIRTKEMHEEAEFGAAAHLMYDESDKPSEGGHWAESLGWVKEMLEVARRSENIAEFAEAVNLDFFKSRIFVFTPKGEVIELPEGSTPLDFAYAIHSDLGNHTHAAKINGKYKSIDTTLHGRETVEIERSKSAKPSAKWLEITRTSAARRKIRSALRAGLGKSNRKIADRV